MKNNIYIFAGSGWRGVSAVCGCGGSLGPGLKSLNFEYFQGPEHVKHEGFGLSGCENSIKFNKKACKIQCFGSRNDVFAWFGYVFDP